MTTDWNDTEGTVEDTGERMVVNCWTNILDQVQENGSTAGEEGEDAPERSRDIYPGNWRKAEGKHTGKGHGGNMQKFSCDCNFPPMKRKRSHEKREGHSQGALKV